MDGDNRAFTWIELGGHGCHRFKILMQGRIDASLSHVRTLAFFIESIVSV